MKKEIQYLTPHNLFFPHGRILEISAFCLPQISTYMNSKFDLWEKTCELEPNLFRSSTTCLYLSLELISSMNYISNILNIPLHNRINEGTQLLPQREKTIEDIRNMDSEAWKGLHGKTISQRIVEFVRFCNKLINFFPISEFSPVGELAQFTKWTHSNSVCGTTFVKFSSNINGEKRTKGLRRLQMNQEIKL